MNLTDVKTTDLQVGDLITEYAYKQGDAYQRVHDMAYNQVPHWKVTSIRHGYVHGRIRANTPEVALIAIASTVVCKVSRGNTVKITTESAKPTSSLWNGRCVVCGANTYTGFAKTEHDGPCQK